MPHYLNDELPKSPISSPPSFSDIPKAAPLTQTEVSLLVGQDKNKSFNLVNSKNTETDKNSKEITKNRVPQNTSLSYNTWKATNAEALHALTGSLGRSEIDGKRVDYKRSGNLKKKQTANYSFPKESDSYDSAQIHLSHPPRAPKMNMGQRPNNDVCYEINAGFPQRNLNQPPSDLTSHKYQNTPFPQEDVFHPNVGTAMPTGKPIHGYANDFCHYTPRELYPISMQHPNFRNDACWPNQNHHPLHRSAPTEVVSSLQPKHCSENQSQCKCKQDQVNELAISSKTELKRLDTESDFTREAKSTMTQNIDSRVPGQDHLNNQTIIDNLYRIIHSQNEQILMLQQQIKQVLQIHVDCDRAILKERIFSHNCHCEHNNSCKKDLCLSAGKKSDHIQTEKKISSKTSSNSYENTPKRSVGVMAIPEEEEEEEHCTNSSDYDKESTKKKTKNVLLKQNKQKQKNSKLPPYKNKPKSSQDDGSKIKYIPPHEKKTVKEVLKSSDQVDNSFSLNEAELVVRNDSEDEEDDMSPNTSVHLDLPDYCSSSPGASSESENAASFEGDNRESLTDEESSDPQLGWTFYNRVVGQVNNVLKKKPTPQQQEPHHMARRAHPNHTLDRNREYDTENNWSKRVTFDGPPVDERSEVPDNMRHPQFHPFRENPNEDFLRRYDYGPLRGPNRMQDLMMYNYANGCTNLSFSTLRYLERYDLLSPQMYMNRQEQVFHNQQKSGKQIRKRTKPRVPGFSQVHQMNQKRKPISDDSRKLLDITALKQQPKLF